jgi:hypothetical protein
VGQSPVLSLESVDIEYNTAGTAGGGLFLASGSGTYLTGCQIADNAAPANMGGGIAYQMNATFPAPSNCLINDPINQVP